MAGANYMGGKRNATRARTKDAAGRAQKRYFGMQRLAAALCRTREDRVHPSKPTLSSELSGINLAHAHRDVIDVPSPANQTFKNARLYSSTPSHHERRHKNPSKILAELDTSDHMSMRAAVDRILRQPDLVGLQDQGLKQTTNNERIHPRRAARRSSDYYPDFQGTYSYSRERLKTPPKNAVDQPKSRSDDLQHGFTTFSGVNPDIGCEHFIDQQAVEKAVLSTSHSPLSNSEDTFDDSGYAEPQLSVDPYPCTPRHHEYRCTNHTFQDHSFSLPQSSPCPSDVQTSDHIILDFDTSPLSPAPSLRFRHSDAQTQTLRSAIVQEAPHTCEEHHDVTTAISIHSVQRSPSYRSIRTPASGPDEQYDRYFMSSPSPDAEDALKTEQFHAICYAEPISDCASEWTDDDELQSVSPSQFRRDCVRGSTSTGATEDIVPDSLAFDFLSDPDPWATIGKILKLEPSEQYTEQSVEIKFTKEREGVGYVSTAKSSASDRGPFDVVGSSSPKKLHLDVKPLDDFRVVLRACTPVPVIEVRNPDGRVTSSPEAYAVGPPLLQLGLSPDTESLRNHPPETKRGVHMDAPKDDSLIESASDIAVAECAHAERARSSFPSVGANVDTDVMYRGPCLFGDSDFSEDE